MNTLSIDIETYSSVDLAKCGVYKYCQSPDFEILLIAYSFNGGTVHVIDTAEATESELFEAFLPYLTDASVLKTAHNAAFERTALAAYFGVPMPAEQWECTMALAAQCGLPLSLDAASKALGLDAKKDAAGKALIRYFCCPCKPTKANGGRTRNLPHHDPEKWEKFIEYCQQDVVVEQAIKTKLSWFKPTETERRVWILDQKINDTGVLLDPVLAENAIYIDTEYRERLTAEAVALTGLGNPNSVSQLKTWLGEALETEIDTLNKESVGDLLKSANGQAERVLQIRQLMAKSSVKKYTAMINAVGRDCRVRGLLQYYGANRTGRWAGRLVQVQNLPQNKLSDLALARQIVRDGDTDGLEWIFGNVPDTLSQLIRTAFVAPAGSRFIVADFSAIEARVIAWLAGERWRMDVFNTHGKIYEASAAQMFKVPLESISKDGPNYHLRAKGKIAELALGYQGGTGALEKMGALKMGLQENELPRLVAMWRAANKAIVNLWDRVNDAALTALLNPGSAYKLSNGVKFLFVSGHLIIRLPSGRDLVYQNARIQKNRFGLDAIKYQGMDQTTKQWGWQETYGGKLVENCTQAVARDLLADALLRLDAAGYKICMHVHDECVLEMPYGQGSTAEVDRIMGEPIPWAAGLPLKAESYETEFYKKD